LPIIQAEAASRRSMAFSNSVLRWRFDPDRRQVCREIFEDWFPWSLYRQHHKHLSSHPQIAMENKSTLSCLGMEEFLIDWSTLKLGEL